MDMRTTLRLRSLSPEKTPTLVLPRVTDKTEERVLRHCWKNVAAAERHQVISGISHDDDDDDDLHTQYISPTSTLDKPQLELEAHIYINNMFIYVFV